MMTDRRGFLGAMFSALAALGLGVRSKSETPMQITAGDGKGLAMIAGGDIQPGQPVALQDDGTVIGYALEASDPDTRSVRVVLSGGVIDPRAFRAEVARLASLSRPTVQGWP